MTNETEETPNETTKVKIYFNPFAFTHEQNMEFIRQGYEVMPIAIPRDEDGRPIRY